MKEKFHIFLKDSSKDKEGGLDVYGWTDVKSKGIVSIKTIKNKDEKQPFYIVLSKKHVIRLIKKLVEVI